MKKVLTFALMAILLGGFAFNADAQGSSKGKVTQASSQKSSKKVSVKKAQTKGENWDKVLDDYDKAVNQCLTIYNALESKDSKVKASVKEFNKALSQAETLRSKIEKAKDGLSRSQVNRFNTANKKLSQVYKK